MKAFRGRLQWRVLVLITGGMGLTLLLSGYFHGLITRSLIEDDRYNIAVGRVVALAERIAALHLLNAPAALQTEIGLIVHSSPDVRQLDVYRQESASKRLVASSAAAAAPLPVLDQSAIDNELHEMDHPLPGVTTIEEVRDGVRFWVITMTLEQGSDNGYVTALVLKNSYNPLIHRLQVQHNVVLGCAIVGCLGMSYVLFLQFFRRPARNIVAAMTRAREGDFGARATVTRRDELGEIAVGFNAMMDDLSARDREREELLTRISHFNESLQAEVHQATANLRSTNAALFQAQQRLGRSERLAAMGQVAASLAHEIGTPLNSIAGHVQLLARRHPDDREVQRRTGIITDQLESIVHCVRELLRRAQKRRLRIRTIEPRSIIDELLRLVGPTLDSHAIAVSTEIAPDLPKVSADPEAFQQVLLNLVNNSVDAMPSGGTLRIAAALDPEGEFVEVSVLDNGPGLAPEIVEHLFEPMWTTKSSGSGFGLAIAREIMSRQGGNIAQAGHCSPGTAFSLRIPVAMADRAIAEVRGAR